MPPDPPLPTEQQQQQPSERRHDANLSQVPGSPGSQRKNKIWAAPSRCRPFAPPTVSHIALLARQRHLPAAGVPDLIQGAYRPRRPYPVSAIRAVESEAASENAPENAPEAALRRDRHISLKPLLSRPTQCRQHSPTHYESSACSARPYCIISSPFPTSSIFHLPAFSIPPSLLPHLSPLLPLFPFLPYLVIPLACSVRHLPPFGPIPPLARGCTRVRRTPAIRPGPPFRRVAQYGRPPGKELVGKDGGMAWLRPGIELSLT